MALTNAERQAKHKAKLRGNVTGNETGNEVTKSNKSLPVGGNVTGTELRYAIQGLTERVQLLEESVAKLAASQARVSVVPGSIIKGVSIGISKEAQASGKHMPDNSPLGRMYRGGCDAGY